MNRNVSIACALLGTMLTLASCVCEDLANIDMGTRATMVEISLTMPLSNASGTSDGYDYGNTYENTLSNYKIYFYNSSDNKFIAELTSSSISSGSSFNEYTITGELAATGEENPLENYSNFKVVMIANWESYGTPAAGSTIEDLCNSTYAQYTALKSEEFGTKSLPFYGVHTYTGVTFTKNGTTRLNGTLALLRAVAKVEIILNNDNDGDNNITLTSATLHNYNAKGYCTPYQVNYSEEDYGQATDEEWATNYTGNTLHLVNGNNDSTPQSELQFVKTQDRVVDANGNVTQKETWIAYIPEYDNSGTDYSYIDLTFDHQLSTDQTNYRIYFAVYDEDGTTKAYDTSADDYENVEKPKRRDVHRNNLYRYNVTVTQGKLYVVPQEWEYVFDNEWVFGNADPETVGYEFYANGIRYEVLTSPAGNEEKGIDPDESAPLTIKTTRGTGDAYEGDIVIPSTILYYGFTYTVTEIGDGSFDGHDAITSISIPATVTKIGDDAFEGCTALTSLYIYATNPPECGKDLFAQDNVGNITLYVPFGVLTVYQQDPTWGSFGFKAIEAIPD